MMHGREKSGLAIVAMKLSNEAGLPVEETVERRAGAMGNADHHRTLRTPSRARVEQGVGRTRRGATAARRSLPVVGAVCGKAARTDLCGGRPVMAVPTATVVGAAGVFPARDVGRQRRRPFSPLQISYR